MADAPIPAATLVVFRDGADGAPELLMVERARAMAFAGGALVFPGGRIEPDDQALATTLGLAEDGAARVAAIRETLEEAGLPIGLSPMPTPTLLTEMRSRLHAGEPFGVILADAGLGIDHSVLVPFARWRPSHVPRRVFDTRFFLARLPDGAPAPVVDATENVRLFWATAADVLADADAGRATVIFPTRRNLERLAQFASFADAVAHAGSFVQRTISPWTEHRAGRDWLCIPDDLGYPVTAEPLADAMRG